MALAEATAVPLVYMPMSIALVGIYGVTSYIVSQRTGEIGVRLAHGADPRAVAAMILTHGGR